MSFIKIHNKNNNDCVINMQYIVRITELDDGTAHILLSDNIKSQWNVETNEKYCDVIKTMAGVYNIYNVAERK